MNNKELILKRLLENKHITIEEMFVLNERQNINNPIVIIKDITPNPLPWIYPNQQNPFWYTTGTSNINPTELKNTLSSDYKMD